MRKKILIGSAIMLLVAVFAALLVFAILGLLQNLQNKQAIAALTSQVGAAAEESRTAHQEFSKKIGEATSTLRDDVLPTIVAAAEESGTAHKKLGEEIGEDLQALPKKLSEVIGEATSSLREDLDNTEGDLALLQRSVLDAGLVYSHVRQSVVEVFIDEKFKGSGFLYGDQRNQILTTAHLWRKLGETENPDIFVKFSNGAIIHASLTGRDEIQDVAILELEEPAPHGINSLPLADYSSLYVGQPIIIIGSPMELEGTITTGIISFLGRDGEPFKLACGSCTALIQTDSATNSGNSGGPGIDAKGEVVGIVSFIIPRTEGIAFLVSSETLKAFVDALGAASQARDQLSEESE